MQSKSFLSSLAIILALTGSLAKLPAAITTSNTPPVLVLNCSTNITVAATDSGGATVFFNLTAAGGCSLPTVISSPPSGSIFPVGTTTVYTSASDTCGDTANCSFTVTVNLTTNSPPIIVNCCTNIVVPQSISGGTYVFYDVTASGGCGPLTITTTPDSGGFFPAGTNTVTVVASDSCGDSGYCSFTVTVLPPPPIVLDCPTNITVTTTAPGGTHVDFNATASGGCDGAPAVQASAPSGSFFPFGTTTVNLTAVDSCDNTTNGSFTVTVVPASTPIQLSVPSNIVVSATSPGGATVFFSASASGGCTPPTISATPASGSLFPAGTTTVLVTASDSCGNSTNSSFQVTVTVPPVILTSSSNITVAANSPEGATVFYTVSANGGCSPPNVAAYPPSGSLFPVGATMVSVTAGDSCGNSTNASFVVTVTNSPIALNGSSNLTVPATGASGATVFYNATAGGGCSPPVITAYPPSGSLFPVGATMVSVTASDNCGASTNSSFVVTVTRPGITVNCASNITVSATSSNGATVFYTTTASGGCTTPWLMAYPPSGSLFPVGVTTVYVDAGDSCDSSANCSFNVTVTSTNTITQTTNGLPSGPPLTISLSGTNQIVLAWPTNTGAPYTVVQAATLGTNWLTVTNQSTIVNGTNQLVLALTNSQGFFQLISTNATTKVSTCVLSLTMTNCDLPELVTLTPPTTQPSVSPGNPVNLAATANLYPGVVAVASYYTNSTGGYSTNCPASIVTNLVAPTIIAESWEVQGPGGYSASGAGLDAEFTPKGCGNGTVEYSLTWQHVCDAGQSTEFISAPFTVNCDNTCLPAGLVTNCAIAGSMAITNVPGITNFCFNNPVSLSATNLILTNSTIIITTIYTNAAGAVTTNCPPTYVTNTVAPTVVSNWWAASGPGSYTNSGAGLTAMFTPTNGGTGTVLFYLAYSNNTPCASNAVTVGPVSVPFNVFQITNQAVSPIPTNRNRLNLGVGEQVALSLVGTPGGNYSWSTTAGSLQPTNNVPSTTFTAPSNAVNASVTINFGGGGASCPLNFTVVAPAGVVSAPIQSTNSFALNECGVLMKLSPVIVGPTTVSFYRVQMLEVGRNATGMTGYFTNGYYSTNLPPSHIGSGADEWFQLGNDNSWPAAWDNAGFWGFPQPWSAGSFTWPIPAQWKIGSGPTNNIAGWQQTCTIDANGTLTVAKFGHSATRTTNNVYMTR